MVIPLIGDRKERVVREEERFFAIYKVSALAALYTVTSFLVICMYQNQQSNLETVQELIFSFIQKHLLRVFCVPSFGLDVRNTAENRTRSLLWYTF